MLSPMECDDFPLETTRSHISALVVAFEASLQQDESRLAQRSTHKPQITAFASRSNREEIHSTYCLISVTLIPLQAESPHPTFHCTHDARILSEDSQRRLTARTHVRLLTRHRGGYGGVIAEGVGASSGRAKDAVATPKSKHTRTEKIRTNSRSETQSLL